MYIVILFSCNNHSVFVHNLSENLPLKMISLLCLLWSCVYSSKYDNNGYRFELKRKNDLISNCSELFFEQYLDHFNYRIGSTPNNISTYMERYFVCGGSKWKQNNPIFFYFGNEGNVEQYINYTGLMWENQDTFNAIMVFAEHRYYGKSTPFNQSQLDKDNTLYRFISNDQAIADYATLIRHIKISWNSSSSAIIGFGGSYGGQLCAWFTIKYPQWIDGCIAGSAPILDFEGVQPEINPNFYAQILTFDASTKGGSLPNDLCKNNIHKAWSYLFQLAKTEQGREKLTNIFHFCDLIWNETVANATAYRAADQISTMAMGSYPYPSGYMTHDRGDLPPFPLRYGCEQYMNQSFDDNNSDALLMALSDLINVILNVSQTVNCYNTNDSLLGYIPGYIDKNVKWNWMACTSMSIPRGVFPMFSFDGINDMFWYNPYNATEIGRECYNAIGIYTRYDWIEINYGGYFLENDGVKNIVFSNGELDPWSGGGVHFNNSNNGIYSISTGIVGHHIDLMFSNVNDPLSVITARQFELQQIQNWIQSKQSNLRDAR